MIYYETCIQKGPKTFGGQNLRSEKRFLCEQNQTLLARQKGRHYFTHTTFTFCCFAAPIGTKMQGNSFESLDT